MSHSSHNSGAPGSSMSLATLESCLRQNIRDCRSALVALSGGVDSSLVLAIAAQELPGKVIAATALSPVYLPEDTAYARQLTQAWGVEHLEVPVDLLALPVFHSNPPDRCYHCKKVIFSRLQELAGLLGMAWVVDGANADDALDYRPGQQAAAELGVRSPLAECGATKAEVRALSRQLGLPQPERPAMACLASRFPYGTPIESMGLDMVRRGEELLRSMGFGQVRLRHHGQIARLEVEPAQLPLLLAEREALIAALTGLGYLYVCADLAGYRQGSLNEALSGAQYP